MRPRDLKHPQSWTPACSWIRSWLLKPTKFRSWLMLLLSCPTTCCVPYPPAIFSPPQVALPFAIGNCLNILLHVAQKASFSSRAVACPAAHSTAMGGRLAKAELRNDLQAPIEIKCADGSWRVLYPGREMDLAGWDGVWVCLEGRSPSSMKLCNIWIESLSCLPAAYEQKPLTRAFEGIQEPCEPRRGRSPSPRASATCLLRPSRGSPRLPGPQRSHARLGEIAGKGGV